MNINASHHFVWDVSPELFSIGPFVVRWYGVLFAVAFVLGYAMFRWIYRVEEKPAEDIDELLAYMLVGTVVGARFGHCFFYEAGYYLANPLEILMFWKGGLASHGAAIGILISLFLYARRKPDQPYVWLLSRMGMAVALGGSLIRLGNFFNSEIIGRATDVPWAVVFQRVDLATRHPSQLYESISYLIIFAILLSVYRRNSGRADPRFLFGLFLTLVFTARFVLEFWKIRQAPFADTLALSIGQYLSIPPILAGVLFLVSSRARRWDSAT